MSVDLFNTRKLIKMVQQLPPEKSFFRSFYPDVRTFETKEVDVDVYEGKRRKAVYVRRNEQATNVEKQGYYTDKMEPGLISLVDTTTAEDLLNRQPGEVVQYRAQEPREMAAERLAKDMAELDSMIGRAEEVQARDAFFDGVIRFTDENGNLTGDEIDFQRHNDLSMTTGELSNSTWDNATATPLNDLDEARRRIQKISKGSVANLALFGETAWSEFINTTQVKDAFDNRRRFDDGNELVRQMIENGAIYRGHIDGFELFTYDEWYEDQVTGDPEDKPMVPAAQVLVMPMMPKTTALYGAVDRIEQGTNRLFALPRVPDSWVEKNPDKRLIRLQAAPLMATHVPNEFCVMDT